MSKIIGIDLGYNKLSSCSSWKELKAKSSQTQKETVQLHL